MDVLRGPTDNLYKFIAISGLAIFCLGIFFTNQLYIALGTANINASVTAQEMHLYRDASLRFVKDRAELLGQKSEFLEGTKPYTIDEAQDLFDDKLNWINDFFEHQTRAFDHSQDARIKTETVYALERSFHLRLWLYGILSGLGLVISVVGFLLWYFRLQRFLDITVRSGAKL